MSVDGTYDMTMKTPMGAQQGKLTLKTDGSALTGTMASPQGEVELFDGQADGNSASWKVKITSPMPMTIESSATVDGDSIKGEAKLGAFGTAPFEGTRTS
jgi:hypothetical protein